MKKKNILNLIKYHAEKNEDAFRNEAYEIAKYFDKSNDISFLNILWLYYQIQILFLLK